MPKAYIIVSGKTEKEALLEGARGLDLEPGEAAIQELDSETFIVARKDAPGQFEITVSPDKMAASIRFITPPFGSGSPVSYEVLDRHLAGLKIVFGINKQSLTELIATVASAGKAQCDIPIASGKPPMPGKDAQIVLKFGRDALNQDPKACNIVRPGQVIAVKEPATKGTNGRNIFGKEIPAKAGTDIKFPPGENAALTERGMTLVAEAYGSARATPASISVSNLVEISSDKMLARMPVFPTLADGAKLTPEDVMTALKMAGVIHGIKRDVVEAALARGEKMDQLIVAEGTPATDGIDARMDFRFTLGGEDPENAAAKRDAGEIREEEIVKAVMLAGEVLARKIPAKGQIEGKTVTGSILKGAEARDKKVAAGTNVALLDDGVTYVVSDGALGYADYVQGVLRVEDPLRVSHDRMCVHLTVHPRSGSYKMITMDMVERMLADGGIVFGIDRGAVERVFKTAMSKGAPVLNQPIARGRPPERGEDGRIELKFQTQKAPGTLISPDGPMDYKERHAIRNVKTGELLAHRVPAAQGKNGMDVFGCDLSSEPGSEKELMPVGNVAVSEDGFDYLSEIDGMVTLTENKIGVFKEYQVRGDVDFSTGNLTVDGSLDVKGWIRSGFTVRAKGEIRVDGGIEDAAVEAGTHLAIKGGVIGAEQGNIQAGGDIRARFFENARVRAGGSIFAHDYMFGCSANALGKILLTEGKGCIRGGSLEAINGIEVKELGAEAGMKTFVAVGEDGGKVRKRMADAEKAIADFRQKREKIEPVLSRYANTAKTKRLPRETLQKLARLSKLRHRIALYETKLIKIKGRQAQEIARIDAEQVSVKVETAVYAGTMVSVKGFGCYINDDIRGKVRFVFRPEQQAVEILAERR